MPYPSSSPSSPFDGIDVVTLQAWLTRAQTAYFNLSMGLTVTEVVTQGDVVKYQRADIGQLAAVIAQLRAAIGGYGTAGAVGVVWSL